MNIGLYDNNLLLPYKPIAEKRYLVFGRVTMIASYSSIKKD